MNKFFLITIDTEGDNMWRRLYSRNAIKHRITTENAKYLYRFQDLCESYKLRPTYLVNYEMSIAAPFVEMTRDGLKRGTLEVGMHMHSWNCPPYYELTPSAWGGNPDLNLFDYAIWHVNHYAVEDRIIYEPLIWTEVGYMLDHVEDIDHTKGRGSLEEIISEKKYFCNFMYSNPKAHMMRDRLFHEISKYKKVDSLGRHLKNVDIEDTRDIVGWEKKSIELKRKYKFTIAAENACFPGYTSEKIMTSMMANSIPIYWGDPRVGEEFNEESFINVNKFHSIEDLITKIRELDEDVDAYKEMLAKPWRTSEQIRKCKDAIDAFLPSVFHIFEQDKIEAVRRPRGCWPDIIYSKFMRFEGRQH